MMRRWSSHTANVQADAGRDQDKILSQLRRSGAAFWAEQTTPSKPELCASFAKRMTCSSGGGVQTRFPPNRFVPCWSTRLRRFVIICVASGNGFCCGFHHTAAARCVHIDHPNAHIGSDFAGLRDGGEYRGISNRGKV